MRPFLVGAGTMISVPGDKKTNIMTTERLIGEAAEKGVELLLLPEVCLTGPFSSSAGHSSADTHEASEPIPGPSTEAIAACARKYRMFVSFGMAERSAIRVPFISQVIVGPDGLVGKNRKRYEGASEHLCYRGGGDDFEVFDLGFARVGQVFCWEGMIAEISAVLVAGGAEVLLAPHCCPVKETEAQEHSLRSWPQLVQYCRKVRGGYLARMAQQNRTPTVFANACPDTSVAFAQAGVKVSGKLMIFSASGEIIAENAGLTEEVLTCRLEPNIG